nr:MAG TPA: hypothetical protein [Caudoviricetes sp.]
MIKPALGKVVGPISIHPLDHCRILNSPKARYVVCEMPFLWYRDCLLIVITSR